MLGNLDPDVFAYFFCRDCGHSLLAKPKHIGALEFCGHCRRPANFVLNFVLSMTAGGGGSGLSSGRGFGGSGGVGLPPGGAGGLGVGGRGDGVWLLLNRIQAVEGRLDVILNALFHVLLKEYKIMAKLDKLIVEVAENSAVIDSAVLLLKGLKDKLDEAGTDPVKLAELAAALDAQTERLAAAIVVNTPADDPPPPPPG